ncbi:putative sugar transporter STL1 [Hortaea werneckii]|nr:putative sugar transporter STL1 [Hortaea werneckii]
MQDPQSANSFPEWIQALRHVTFRTLVDVSPRHEQPMTLTPPLFGTGDVKVAAGRQCLDQLSNVGVVLDWISDPVRRGAAFMLYGYDAGVLGGFQERQEFRDAVGNPQGPYIIPLIASIYNLAAGFMSLAVPFFGMQIGRKGTIQLGHLLVCIGALLQSSAYSLTQITVGRIVAGAGIGCIASAVPTYMAEMSLEASQRGPETQYQLALLISGIPLAYWIDLGFVQGLEQHPYLWRFPLAMQSCFSIFSGGLLLFLPDTPRWYYARDRHEEGNKTLAHLHGKDVNDEAVQTMRRDILASLHEDDGEKSDFNIKMLFWDHSNLQIDRRLRTSFLILFAQQFVRINMLGP